MCAWRVSRTLPYYTIHVSGLAHLFMCHDSLIWGTWVTRHLYETLCDVSAGRVARECAVVWECALFHLRELHHSHKWNSGYMYMQWLVDMWDLTHCVICMKQRVMTPRQRVSTPKKTFIWVGQQFVACHSVDFLHCHVSFTKEPCNDRAFFSRRDLACTWMPPNGSNYTKRACLSSKHANYFKWSYKRDLQMKWTWKGVLQKRPIDVNL